MRHAAAALLMAGLAVAAQAYPVVSSDPNTVELNVWNTGLTQAKAKAKALNRPTLMVMLDSVNCGYSKSWITKIADAPAFRNYLAANPLVLVMADKPKMSSGTWYTYTLPHREPDTGTLYYPTVVLFRPDGTVADRFIARSTLGSDPGFYNRARSTTDQYPFSGPPPATTTPGTIGFASASVTVSEGAAAVTVSVTRQGGGSGAQTFAFTTADGTARAGVHYTAASGSLSWAAGDTAAKTVTVPLINDHVWTSPTTRALTLRLTRVAGTATLGTAVQTVTLTEVTPADPADPLPVLTANGSYQGFFYDCDDLTVCGTLSLTASTRGALSARVVLDGQAYSLQGTWPAGGPYEATLQTRSGNAQVSVLVDASGHLSGAFNDAALFGRRLETARLSQFTGYYTSLLGLTDVTPASDEIDNRPQGAGYLTFSVSTRGSVTYSGYLADGTRLSGSSLLMVFGGAELAELGYTDVDEDQTYACFPLYKPLYSQRGAVAGQIWISGMLSPLPDDNGVFITGSKWAYPGKSAAFPDDGFVGTFDDGLFTEIGARFVLPQSLAETYDGATFEVDDGAVYLEASGASVKLPSGNDLGASLTVSRTTGLFSGRFLHDPLTGASPYTVKFTGVLVPALGLGGGYYLEPYETAGGERLKQSKAVLITP